MATHTNTLERLLQKKTTVRDSSFPLREEVVLRGDAFYWCCGTLGFLLAVVVLLAGVWAGLERSILGHGELEGWLWRYWWWKQLLVTSWQRDWGTFGRSVIGICTILGWGNVLDFALLSYPLERLFGAPSYYNVKVALVLLLNCLCAWYVIARIWGANFYAWIAGLIFGANSYVLVSITQGRTIQAMVFLIPLAVWAAHEAFTEVNGRAWLVLAVILGLSALLYPPYGAGLVLLLLLWVLWSCSPHCHHGQSAFAYRCAKAVVLGAVIALPCIISPFLGNHKVNLISGIGQSSVYGERLPSLAELKSVSPLTPLEEELLSGNKDGHEQLVKYCAYESLQSSVGLDVFWNPRYSLAVPLFALLLLLVPCRWDWDFPLLWIVLAFVFFVLALGPYACVLGDNGTHEELVPLGGWPLPFAIAYRWIPGVSLWPPNSLLVVAYFALAVLVNLKLRDLYRHSQGWTQFVSALLVASIVWQLGYVGLCPLDSTRIEMAPIYFLLKEEAPSGLIEVPLGYGDFIDCAQTVHGHKVLGSEATRCCPPVLEEGQDLSGCGSLARAKVEPKNTFVTMLLAANKDSEHWRSYANGDRQKLVDDGYSLLVLHERGCNLLDAQKGEVLYFRFFSHFESELGEPIINSFEPVYERMPGRRSVDVSNPVWYRVAVFDLRKSDARVQRWIRKLQGK